MANRNRDENLAQWLGRQLRRHEWTQADLSRKSGLSQGRISDWLAGKRLPNPESCDKLADALGDDPDYVLKLAGHRPHAYIQDDPETAAIIALVRKVKWDARSREWIRSTLEAMIKLPPAGGAK